AVTVVIENGALVIQHPWSRIEIPCESVARVVPWAIPLPSGGIWFRLASGRRFRYGLQIADPRALTVPLPGSGPPAAVRARRPPETAICAAARRGSSVVGHPALRKFVGLGLRPALRLFRRHKWVASGGTFREYCTSGMKASLLGFALYWATYAIYLVRFAA